MNEKTFNAPFPCLISLATAVPRFEIGQSEVQALGKRLFKQRPKTFERLSGAYSNAGIERRYSCVPMEWYEQDHGWKDRTKLFVENALELLISAATEALTDAGLSPDEIDGLVTVSSTGIAVPSLDGAHALPTGRPTLTGVRFGVRRRCLGSLADRRLGKGSAREPLASLGRGIVWSHISRGRPLEKQYNCNGSIRRRCCRRYR